MENMYHGYALNKNTFV